MGLGYFLFYGFCFGGSVFAVRSYLNVSKFACCCFCGDRMQKREAASERKVIDREMKTKPVVGGKNRTTID